MVSASSGHLVYRSSGQTSIHIKGERLSIILFLFLTSNRNIHGLRRPPCHQNRALGVFGFFGGDCLTGLMTSAELRLGQSCNVTRRFTFALPHSRPRHQKSFDLIFSHLSPFQKNLFYFIPISLIFRPLLLPAIIDMIVLLPFFSVSVFPDLFGEEGLFQCKK
ncbi:hypothetical protein BO85DRAFT_185268 [Aspergillus piperis CBS 112811]|uniref:Uncharacterized protein n=1 Tax=Aspergillus piperis CBS 112811 TaxID=1448313 RepID=A0A8G1R7K7_9EURO|nr:hypothetical protein BO85DRAFT_185268 [Aspergillus piperis CBS 112811]RAH61033.1 hypothetical protein BO85DRAFT_185268 [Aspergillus piperis CBS 112811]